MSCDLVIGLLSPVSNPCARRRPCRRDGFAFHTRAPEDVRSTQRKRARADAGRQAMPIKYKGFAARIRGDDGLPAADYSSSSRSAEEHTSDLQSLMRIQYAVFCLKK